MTHDEDMLDLCELVADGHCNSCDDDIRELASWALLQRRELELERQARHRAETDRNALAARLALVETRQRQADELWSSASGPTASEPEWLTILRASGALS